MRRLWAILIHCAKRAGGDVGRFLRCALGKDDPPDSCASSQTEAVQQVLDQSREAQEEAHMAALNAQATVVEGRRRLEAHKR